MKIGNTLFLLLILAACSNSPKENAGDSTPTKTVTDFLKWYRTNENRMMNIGIVNQDNPNPGDSTFFYSVNFEESEKYLTEIKNSGYVSDKYLEEWRNYFAKADETFKVTHQYDGPPEGFDFDLIMWSQDFDLNDIEKSKFTEHIDGNQADVIVEFPYDFKLKYDLTKENDLWLIDHIENASAN